MRYTSDHKQKTLQRVLEVAARAIRASGPHGIGVADVMAKAGLTHGGFYAHFRSKSDLIAQAIEQMFSEAAGHLHQQIDGREPREGLIAYIDFYLSPAHRDDRPDGCPIAALAADLPRLPMPVRRQFSQGVRRWSQVFARLLARIGNPDAQAEADSMAAELLGALSLARIEPDPKRSNAILASSRQTLKRRLDLGK